MNTINVGVIGFGTIGTGVVRILQKDGPLLEQRSGRKINLKSVADIVFNKKDGIDMSGFQSIKDGMELVNDPEIDIVVEVIGGCGAAKTFIETALKNKKHVVTANKELVSKHGASLFALAKENNVNLFCEASVGGGIPIINALTCSLAGNPFNKIYGILNGTTNYILSKMYDEGADFTEVLREAQDLGYAEADPSSDVDGHDVAYKLSILSAMAFDSFFDINQIHREGIRKISIRDIQVAKQFGYVIKLLAIGITPNKDEAALRVHPVMISKDHPLASVNSSFNAVYVEGENVGEAMFYGRGAGELPTASAVLGDIVDIARHIDTKRTSQGLNFGNKQLKLVPMDDIQNSYYLRLQVTDKPGVLSAISQVFGDNDVSIKVVQQDSSGGEKTELVIMTHEVLEAKMQKAIAQIEKLDVIDEVSALIRTDLD